ncbi:hypothetical protein PIB30_004733 [Stylosanthes scabra]|uniref:Uncharacterized protein n=1 Tax=Stylosanthes scabra TaxID=79078 RepID=A0ABU6S3A1_9FABA|nr:hypothetical protein [Stylosanthes scabra]
MKFRRHFTWQGNTIEIGPLEGPREMLMSVLKVDKAGFKKKKKRTRKSDETLDLKSQYGFPACHREPFDEVNVRLTKLERIWRWQKVVIVTLKSQDNKQHPDAF